MLDKDQGNYVITHDQQEIILSPAGHLAFDHIQIITTAINRIKNKLDYQPQILRILGNTFTLRQAREVFAAFLGTTIARLIIPTIRKLTTTSSKKSGPPLWTILGGHQSSTNLTKGHHLHFAAKYLY